MKLSIFSNDKTTMKDELILLAISLTALVLGIMLIVFRPSFWIVRAEDSIVLGVLFITFFVMFLPSLIYRFATNTEMKKDSKTKDSKQMKENK